MNELAQALIGDSAAAPPAHILEGVAEDLAHQALQFAPHTIYEELWHITFWQQVTLDWVNGIETPFPGSALSWVPTNGDAGARALGSVTATLLRGLQQVAAVAALMRLDCRPTGSLSLTAGQSRPHHDRPRATGEPGSSQCLSFRAHRSASPALSSVAAALRRLQLVIRRFMLREPLDTLLSQELRIDAL